MLSEQPSASPRADSSTVPAAGALPECASSTAATVYGRASSDPRVIVADGRNVQVRVERGHLSILDGIGQHRRTRTLSRIERTVRRVIILADNGYVTWDAARWCADVGITLVQADRSGRLVTVAGASQPEDARLLRAQAFAGEGGPHASAGVDIVKYVLARKLDGHATIAAELLGNPTIADTIRGYAADVAGCETVAAARSAEGAAGAAYWQAWTGRVIVPFDPREVVRVPAHWTTFVARKSPIGAATGRAHHAADPINALLNYAYRLAEAECRLACLTVGLDPSLGFLHVDKQGRDSLALDLVEILRPEVDRFVLDLLCTNGPMSYLSPKLFTEESDGGCRLVPPITHVIAEQTLTWTRTIAPHVERIAKALAAVGKGTIGLANRLTEDHALMSGPKRTPSKPLRLSGEVTVERIIPDDLWATIEPMLPGHTKHPRTGRPMRSNRAVLAAVVCVEQLGCSWSKIPPTLGVSRHTCTKRLNDWRHAGAWTAIEPILDTSEHLHRLRSETHMN
jgi:CRISPR-associated endonuclease Cas1